MAERIRNVGIFFRVTGEEKKAIESRMKETGETDMGRYLRKLALTGYFVNVDMSDFRDYSRQIALIGNNINQIARKVNLEQEIYAPDVEELNELVFRMEKLVNESVTNIFGIGSDEFGDIEDCEN